MGATALLCMDLGGIGLPENSVNQCFAMFVPRYTTLLCPPIGSTNIGN